ncbi:hypothetical protein [Fodinicola feengrottensis]|uniref:hypothetical protein n=1 Tax=Fodinicola feengrottensis TaxID=435914 RepID=UPI0024420AA8|nr:hypothetical protein [Fodinicola feengrottensis]
MKRGESSGTSIRYWYDSRYFEANAALDVDAVRAKLRNTAFLVPGVTYVLKHATDGTIGEETLHYPSGLSDMVDFLAPADEKPVSGTLLIVGDGTYKENAADAEGVMRSNVERQAEVEVARAALGHRLRAYGRVLHQYDPQRARRHPSARF